jgi:hypothetical protein
VEFNLPCSDQNGSRRKIDQDQMLFRHVLSQKTSQKQMPARAAEMLANVHHLPHGEIPGRRRTHLIG